MEKKDNLDDIVAMIDSFMLNEGGHMNISFDGNRNTVLDKQVTTTPSLECTPGSMACSVPTLHEGLDGEE